MYTLCPSFPYVAIYNTAIFTFLLKIVSTLLWHVPVNICKINLKLG